MKLGNEPAMPLPEPEQWVDPYEPSKGTYDANGLTKREYFAGLAMQGILMADTEYHMDRHDIAIQAVAHADALLNQLQAKERDYD